MAGNLFFDIGLVIIIAAIFALIARFFKQPLILAYMLAGIVLGPAGLKLISDQANILTLSEIGIAFMLFIVGLELDLKRLGHLGIISVTVGIGQVLFTFLIGYFIALLLHFSSTAAFYIAIALTFSSTVIVVKLLSDKNELNTLHGRAALGVLLVQDFVAIILLTVLSGKTSILGVSSNGVFVSFALMKVVTLILIAFAGGFYVLKYLFRFIAKNQELLFLFSVAWCFLLALLSHAFRFSIAIGAFLAGVSLANLPYNIEIISRMRSLRDFFATIFFVSLGMEMTFGSFKGVLIPVIIFSLFVLIGNPIIIQAVMGLFRYKARTSFLTGISLAQISEFSLILVAFAYGAGIITQKVFSIVAFVGVITITVSTYMITYDQKLYHLLKPFAKLFERKRPKRLEYYPIKRYDAVLCGCRRMGGVILKTLKKLKKNVLVVDFDPEVIKRFIRQKQPCVYGDIGDLELIERLPFAQAQFLVSTIPDPEDNMLLIGRAKGVNKKIIAIVTASHADEALELYDAGADYVILPHYLSGKHVALVLEEADRNIKNIFKHKRRHLKELKKR